MHSIYLFENEQIIEKKMESLKVLQNVKGQLLTKGAFDRIVEKGKSTFKLVMPVVDTSVMEIKYIGIK